MDSQLKEEHGSRCFIASMLTTSILSAAAAIALIVLTWSSSGFTAETSIVIQNCSSTYMTQKYENMGIIDRTVFIAGVLAALISLQISLTSASWFCKASKTPSPPPRGKLFFFSSCLTLTAIPVLGYYFSFFVELNNCSDLGRGLPTIMTLGVSAILMVLALTLIIIIACNSSSEANQTKYRVVETYQTETREEMKGNRYNWKADIRKENSSYKTPHQAQLEAVQRQNDLTNEALIIPPLSTHKHSPRRPFPQIKSNSPHNSPPHNDNVMEDRALKRPVVNMEQRITDNLHPHFMNVDPREYVRREKNKQQYQVDVQDAFLREQQRYLQQMNPSILPRGGLQERSRNQENVPYQNTMEGQTYSFNYAKANHHPNQSSKYYSPERAKNEQLGMHKRQYISHGNQNSYPFPYQSNHPPPFVLQRNQRYRPDYNSREDEYQEQSFKFYEENLPRRKYYR